MPPLVRERRGSIVVATLASPQTRNAIDDAMAAALVALCADVQADATAHVLVLAAQGPAFCAGGNLRDMAAREGMYAGSPAAVRQAFHAGIQQVPLAFHALEVPVVAAINGPAVGAGLDLALMCDIRIASSAATFAESFVKLGLVSGDGGAWWLRRIVGAARTAQMTFTGDTVDAATALAWGIVSEVVAGDVLLDAALEIAGRIARHPAHSLRLNKRLLRDAEHASLPEHLHAAAALQAIALHTDDAREGVAAALERRPPRFTGR
ncbi:MAG: enoyl-CoA hydratase/isomerase family protein [Proteobacteria bacterium]|nr:enoyl-CoA hydratase/isomerase family protein [Pseudomonadota bacterium]